MKLSEAIRLGAMLKPQGFGSRALYDEHVSCALGAARDAVGVATAADVSCQVYTALEAEFPILRKPVRLPVERKAFLMISTEPSLTEAIYTLNDLYQWTREQIADWVETLEIGPIVREDDEEPTPDVEIAPAGACVPALLTTSR